MSWLRTTSLSFARQLSKSLDPRNDYEPQACYSSFCKHWQQAHDIIVKSQPQHLHDDVLGVVNHLEQLATLLVLEARAREVNSGTIDNPTSCLEYLLSENLLDKLYEWAICTGKYENAVRLEQLKLFGSLISHYSSQVIAAEPFLRPLLKLLSGFRNELPPSNVESQLVTVCNQLCVALMQNMKLIDLFFLTTHTYNGSQNEFIIVRLLLSSVHREGRTGACARDSLLLCAKMSARSEHLADYMLHVSNTCPVLATGLSGLYSLLPRTLNDGIHRLSPDDVNKVHKLTLFIDSLEFCNAVAQVAHPSIKKHLLDLLFQGFLVPVMGPALLQTKAGTLQSGAPEQVAATAYLELCVRCVTPRGLLRTILKFLMHYEYDGVRVLDVLLGRLDGNCQLSLVSLALMETLIDLNCEDVMIELIYKYLLTGHHLMLNHRHKISDIQPYRDASLAFLSLSPRCCTRPLTATKAWVDDLAVNGKRVLDFRSKEDIDAKRATNGFNDHSIAMSNLVQEVSFNYGNPNVTLFGNYHAYLSDARFEIVSRTLACSKWTSKYDSTQLKTEPNNNTKEIDIPQKYEKEQDSLISVYNEQYSLTSLIDIDRSDLNGNLGEAAIEVNTKEGEVKDCSLPSLGESSGYDSFKYRCEEEEGDRFVEDSLWKCIDIGDGCELDFDTEVPVSRNWRASVETIIGPFLSCLLKKAAHFLELDITENVRVTGVICKLVALPTPLLTSLFLCPGFMLQPNVPSLFQILSKLRSELDEMTSKLENVNQIVDKARVYLIQREMSLIRNRTQTTDDGNKENNNTMKQEDVSLKRVEPKRRSLSTSFSSMFGRRLSNSSQPPQSLPLQSPPHVPKRINFTQDAYWNQSIMLRAVLNAVLLDEWLKELASLAEEHALRLSSNFEDDVYMKAVGL